ncbi:MAG: hypothetical protein RR206_04820 [Bacteroidaceae bacterium]
MFTRTVQLTIPENYGEMTPRQFLASVRLSKEWIDDAEFFRQFFGIPRHLLRRLDSFYIYKLIGLITFVQDTKHPFHAFYLERLPGDLRAPRPKLRGMCLQQFMTVDTFFSWYLLIENMRYLDLFIAALYLPPATLYVPRQGETPLDIEAQADLVHPLAFDLKYAILVNWALIKAWLSDSFPHLFPPAPPSENSTVTGRKGKPSSWLTLFDNFVGDNIASIDAYKALPCMDAMRIINRRIKEAKKR